MAYCTVSDVRSASSLNDATNIVDAYITIKINLADGVINGKIGGIYTLPLASTPGLIKGFSIELAIAFLFMDQFGEEAEDKDKGWQKRIDAIVKLLDEIRAGKIKLFDDTTGAELAGNGLGAPKYKPSDATSDPDAENTTKARVTIGMKL